MMSDTSTSTPSDVTGQSQLAPLQLAFVGGPRDGQSIRINAAKCTIGSAEQATLRLVCKGVHPTHCMILRGTAGTIVKRMSEDTSLNDNSFEEAELNENDVLTIGPLRFRVLPPSGSATADSAAVAAVASAETDSEAEQLRERCDELMSQLEALQQGPDSLVDNQIADQANAEQPEQANAEQPVAEQANAELEQRLMELEAARERDRQELEAKRAEIEAAQVEAQQAREALDAMQQQQQDETAADVASALGVEAYQPEPEEEYSQNYPQASRTMAMDMLNRLREEAPAVPNRDANQQSLMDDSAFTQPLNQYDQAPSPESSYEQSSEPSSFEQSQFEQSTFEQSQEQAASPYEQPQSAYEPTIQLQGDDSAESPSAAESFSAVASPYDAAESPAVEENDAAASSYAEPEYSEPAAEEPETQFESYETTADSGADSSAATPTTEEELSFSEPVDSAPIDTASILAKFGHTLDEDDDEGVTGTISLDNANDAAASSFSDASEAPSGGGGAGDESIDDYMTQLMARVGGGDYQAPAPSSPDGGDASPAIMLDSNVKDEPKPKANAAPLDPSEFVPRAVAPEASSNLRALRAVANTSARSAIDRHQRRSFDNKAYICWFIAIASAIVCFSMAFFAKNLISLPTLVSMVSLLISFFATINALAFSAKAKIGARSTQKKLAANIEEASVPRLPAK